MHKLEELREMLMAELEKCSSKGELSAGSLEVIDKLAHAIKSIDTIIAMEEEGYSNEGGYSRARGGGGGRGRGSNARRDSMGRYSSRGGSYDDMSYEGGGMSNEGGSYGGGSYEGGSYGGSYARGGRGGGGRSNRGYSRADAKENLANELREIAMDTQDTEIKQMIHKWIKQVED